MTPRFLIDHGTATLSAALVAHLDGRWRLIASAAFPAGIETDAALAFVAERAAGLLDDAPDLRPVLPVLRGWRDLERIEALSAPPRRIALLAPTARRAADLEAAASQAGWLISARLTPERSDALAVSVAVADLELDALALAAADPPRADEREAVADLAAIAGAVVARRPELVVVLSGAAAEQVDRFPFEQVVLAPAPPPLGAPRGGSDLSRILMALAGQPNGARLAAARTASTLATVLERTVESVDVGASGGAWFRATPPSADLVAGAMAEPDAANGALGPMATAELDGFLLAAGAMVPERALDDEEDLDAVIAWSPLRIDRPTHRDRLRDLRTRPWRDAAGDGALLRMAAGRAALARIEAERVRLGGAPAERMRAPDLIVLAGGAFALAPGPAVALAAADTIRRLGMTQVAYDHARLLAPLGVVGDSERASLVADLADDLLLPLGSVLVLAAGRPGREFGTLHVDSEWATGEAQPLASGALRLVELPPGAPARVELEVRDGRFGRTRARRVGFEATGGLAGLLVDTRGIPLRLPQRSERRREVLAQWQRTLWPGAE
ncbi:MAG TPA: hypothetical protein VJ141_02120 [Candidatus Limnocylindrales bacterium]|nr:hypothetical protein [Candidatus Limnocylindrales bacterium]